MRQLGSFNQRVNLPRHAEDHAPSGVEQLAVKTLQTGGYTLGIAHNAPPNEQRTPTGGNFTQARKTPGRQRMAGQALNAQVTQGTGQPSVVAPTEPMIGSAELRTPNIPQ
jgi:hypothetical protein